MADIFPILVNPDGFDTATYSHRPLTISDDADLPLVAFLHQHAGDEPEFVTIAALKKRGQKLRDLEARARQALLGRTARPGWTPLNIPYGGGEVTILIRRGDQFTASDILDPELLRIAESYFSSPQVFVAVPARDVMLAADSGLYIHDLVIQTIEQKRAQGLEVLSARVFCTEAGEISGIAEFEDRDIGEPEARPAATLYHVNGRNALWFELPPASGAELCRDLETLFNDHVAWLAEWEGFQGPLIFNIQQAATPLTPAERAAVADVAASLTARAAQHQWVSPYGDPVSVLVEFLAPGVVPPSTAAPVIPDTPDIPDTPAAPPAAPPAKASSGRKFKYTAPGLARATGKAAGGAQPGASGARHAPAADKLNLLVPVSVRQLRRQIPNQLGLAIWAIRLWYLIVVFGLLGAGVATVVLLPRHRRAAAEAAVMKEAQAARLKAEEEAAKKRRAAAAAAAEDDAEDEAEDEGTGAEPAPAKSRPAREAPDTRTAGGKKVVGRRLVTSTGQTLAVEKPAGPEASASAVAATAGDLAARSAQQTAFLCFAALAFAAAVVFVLQELVLLAGLSALRGWARWLGLVQSVIFSLSVGLLPFGAPILLGLTNAGTVLLFTEARRLRAAGQFRD